MYGNIIKTFTIDNLQFSLEYTWCKQINMPQILGFSVYVNNRDITRELTWKETARLFDLILDALIEHKLEIEYECAHACLPMAN